MYGGIGMSSLLKNMLRGTILLLCGDGDNDASLLVMLVFKNRYKYP
jgi:hypothetical protein